MNAWEAIVCALRAERTEYVFGLPGGDLFYDSLYDAPEIKTVLVREEISGPRWKGPQKATGRVRPLWLTLL